MVDANALRSRKERPRRVKMLIRDFIEGIVALAPYGLDNCGEMLRNKGR